MRHYRSARPPDSACESQAAFAFSLFDRSAVAPAQARHTPCSTTPAACSTTPAASRGRSVPVPATGRPSPRSPDLGCAPPTDCFCTTRPLTSKLDRLSTALVDSGGRCSTEHPGWQLASTLISGRPPRDSPPRPPLGMDMRPAGPHVSAAPPATRRLLVLMSASSETDDGLDLMLSRRFLFFWRT